MVTTETSFADNNQIGENSWQKGLTKINGLIIIEEKNETRRRTKMKATYTHTGRQYSASWNEKIYGDGACYVIVTALDTQSQQKVVFNAHTGVIRYGNRTREYANAALASIEAAPFNRFEFVPPVVNPEMSVKEAAKSLGVSLSTIYRRIHAGKAQVSRVRQSNGRWQYMVVLPEKSAQAA